MDTVINGSGARALGAAIIGGAVQTIRDAIAPLSGDAADGPARRRHYRAIVPEIRWLASDGNGPLSFGWLCGCLRLNAGMIRRRVARELLATGDRELEKLAKLLAA